MLSHTTENKWRCSSTVGAGSLYLQGRGFDSLHRYKIKKIKKVVKYFVVTKFIRIFVYIYKKQEKSNKMKNIMNISQSFSIMNPFSHNGININVQSPMVKCSERFYT